MKKIVLFILLAWSAPVSAQWKGVTGPAQKNTSTGEIRWNFGADGIFAPNTLYIPNNSTGTPSVGYGINIDGNAIFGGTLAVNGNTLTVGSGAITYNISNNRLNLQGGTAVTFMGISSVDAAGNLVTPVIYYPSTLTIGPTNGGFSTYWGENGVNFKTSAGYFRDDVSTGTISALNAINSFKQPSVRASLTATYTNAATVFIEGEPLAGVGATITNPYSLYIKSGNTYSGGNITIAGLANIAKMYPTTLGPDSIMAHGSDGKLKIIPASAFGSGSYITTNTTQTGLTGDKSSTGTFNLGQLNITPTGGTGYITLAQQTVTPTYPTNGTQLIYSDSYGAGVYNRLVIGGNTNTDRNLSLYNTNSGSSASVSSMLWADGGRFDRVVTSSTYNLYPGTLINANQAILVGNGVSSLLMGMETAGDVIMIAGGNGTSNERLRLISGGGVTSQGLFKMQGITLASTPTSQTAGLDISVTSAGSNATYYPVGTRTILSAGYTGSAGSRGARFINNVAGTGTDVFSAGTGNIGVEGDAQGTTTGTNVANYGIALNGNINYGTLGIGFDAVKASSVNIGAAGFATNTGASGIKIGGYFGNKSSSPTYNTSAALIADGDGTNPVFLGKVNGTTKVTITGTGDLTVGGKTASGTGQITTSSDGGVASRGATLEMHSGTAGDGIPIYGIRTGGTQASPSIVPGNSYGFDLSSINHDGSVLLNNGDMGYRIISPSLGNITGEWFFSVTPTGTGGSDPYTLGSVKLKISATAVTSLVPFTATRLNVSTSSNNGAGTTTLVAGTSTVSNTSITASSIILLTRQTIGGTTGTLSYTLSAGTSFTINSTSATDTSTIGYVLVN